MKKLWLGIALAFVLPACGGDGGTYVKLNFEQGTAPPQVARIHLDVTLGSGQAMAPLDLPGPITFPASKVLEIRHGEGAFMVTAIAFDGGNLEVARGTASGAVMRGETLGLTLRFGSDNMRDDERDGDDACIGCIDAGASDFSLTPGTLDFGQVFAGLSSPDRTFTVTNAGSAPTEALLVRLTGNGFTKGTDGCDGQVLAAGATCDIKVAFTPQAAGAASAILRVIDAGATVRTLSSNLSGTAVTPPALSLGPTMGTFVDTVAGANSADVTFTVSNTGGGPTGGLTVTSSDATQFVLGTDNCTSRTLAPSDSCTVNVRFHPLTTGTKNATLTVTATPGGMATAALTGLGLTGAVLAIGPSSHDFGAVLAGAQSGTFNFTVSNTGGAASGALGAAALGSATDFAITADGCMGMTLAPGANCTVTARFQPVSVGSKSTTVTVMASPGGMDSATVTGTGQSAAALSAPTTQDFGTVTVNASTTANIVVTNTGDVVTSALTVTPPTRRVQRREQRLHRHAGPRRHLHHPAALHPHRPGPRPAGSLQISATAGGTRTVALSGTGLPPGLLTITPAAPDLGATLQGTTGTTATLTVRNTGGSPSGTIATARAGTNAAEFALTADNCNGVILAANATCTVGVVFQPTSAGSKTASVSAAATPGGIAIASLTATGLAPAALSLTPASNPFPSTAVFGNVSAPFVLRNTGGVPTGAITVAVAGANMSEFVITSNGCSAGLAAGGTCGILVAFQPSSSGSKTASLNATSGTLMASSTLTGTGLAPATLIPLPAAHSFGNVVVSQSSPRSFTVTNTGDVAIPAAMTTTLGGTHAAQFALASNNCVGVTLQAGVSCTLSVVFTPTSVGTKTANLVLASGALNYTIQLDGIGLAPAQLTISPPSSNFMGVLLGSSTDLSFTIGNSGGVASGTLTFPITGTDAAQFVVVPGGTCFSGTTTLSPGGSCTITVRFSPTSRGAKTATITATANPGSTAAATLMGTGQAPAMLTSAMSSRDFGPQGVGTTSAPYTWTVQNSGDVPTAPLSVNGAGAFAASHTCGVLAAGASCPISVRFAPLAPGSTMGTVTAMANPGGAVGLNVMGLGVGNADLRIVTFTAPNQPAVGTSFDYALSISNLGPDPAMNVSLAVTLAPSLTFFSASSGCTRAGQVVTCTAATLASSATLPFNITVTPTVTGLVTTTASLSATEGDPNPSNNSSSLVSAVGNGGGTFAAFATYATSGSGSGIAASDLNSDGKLDLVEAQRMTGYRVLMGNGDGTFVVGTQIVSSSAYSVALGDLNADGKPDLVGGRQTGSAEVMLGTGTGTFSTAVTYTIPADTYGCAIANLDADTAPDLVFATVGGLVTLKGNGDGTFQTFALQGAAIERRGVAPGDLNGDGRLDLVTGDYTSSRVLVFLGNGDGTFQPSVAYLVGSSPRDMAVGDLDSDGKMDVVVVNSSAMFASVLLGNGDGTLRTPTQLPTTLGARTIQIADLNADSLPDVVVGETDNGAAVSVHMGSGGGSFLPRVAYPAGSKPYGVVVGRFNADSKPDIAAAVQSAVSVLLAN